MPQVGKNYTVLGGEWFRVSDPEWRKKSLEEKKQYIVYKVFILLQVVRFRVIHISRTSWAVVSWHCLTY